jgi:hypothetical protein
VVGDGGSAGRAWADSLSARNGKGRRGYLDRKSFVTGLDLPPCFAGIFKRADEE